MLDCESAKNNAANGQETSKRRGPIALLRDRDRSGLINDMKYEYLSTSRVRFLCGSWILQCHLQEFVLTVPQFYERLRLAVRFYGLSLPLIRDGSNMKICGRFSPKDCRRPKIGTFYKYNPPSSSWPGCVASAWAGHAIPSSPHPVQGWVERCR